MELVRECLPTGDYWARHGEENDKAIIERKAISDLFSSFTHNYDNERKKIQRASELGLRYILAIEASALTVRQGFTYRDNDGIIREAAKPGIAQVRQIMTICRKYGIEAWFCQSREEMAFRIMEYFLAAERVK